MSFENERRRKVMDNVITKTTMTRQNAKNVIQPDNVLDTLRNYINVDGLDIVMDLDKSQGVYIYEARNNRPYLDLFSFLSPYLTSFFWSNPKY